MPGDPIEVEYPLTLSAGRSQAIVLLVVALTVGIAFIATSNTKGLRIGPLITLDVDGANIFYWAMTAACGLFALPMALATAYRASYIKQRIGFTRSSIWLPRTLWTEEWEEVPFGEIAAITMWSYHGESVITLDLANRKFRIGRSWLPSPEAFEDVVRRLRVGRN